MIPTNILEECYENGVKRLCPIYVKNEPEQKYITIDLSTITECLPPLSEKVHYKEDESMKVMMK